jgi:hypothetical protein
MSDGPAATAAVNKVYKGNVLLNDAASIAKFSALLCGVTKIEGDVDIGSEYGADFDPGSRITEAQLAAMFGAVRDITGRVGIVLCHGLSSLEGLRSLTTIGGYLWIDGNTSLASVEGLRALTAIGGYLDIFGNRCLATVEGLRNLKCIRGSTYKGHAISLLANGELARGLPFPALLCKNGKARRSSLNNDYVKLHLAALKRVPNNYPPLPPSCCCLS